MKQLFSILLLAYCVLLGTPALQAHSHGHTTVIVDDHHHGDWHHPDERVYVDQPWYHHDHVYYSQGHAYPHYYYGNPYYYYDPNYYYNDQAPAAVNVNVQLN